MRNLSPDFQITNNKTSRSYNLKGLGFETMVRVLQLLPSTAVQRTGQVLSWESYEIQLGSRLLHLVLTRAKGCCATSSMLDFGTELCCIAVPVNCKTGQVFCNTAWFYGFLLLLFWFMIGFLQSFPDTRSLKNWVVKETLSQPAAKLQCWQVNQQQNTHWAA